MPTASNRLSSSRATPHAPNFIVNRAGLARLFIFAVTWLTVAVAWGQLQVLPSAGKFVGYVSAPAPGKWIVMAASEFLPVPVTLLEGGKAIVFEAEAGKYGCFYFPPGDGQPVVQVVILGKGVVPPTPDPPLPPPGTRWAVIWEQTEQRTPAQASLYIALRKQFQKDRLMILDVDQLPPDWEAIRKLADPKTLPALAVFADKALVRTVPLPSTVDGVIVEVAK
jgi:hypothetical protein